MTEALSIKSIPSWGDVKRDPELKSKYDAFSDEQKIAFERERGFLGRHADKIATGWFSAAVCGASALPMIFGKAANLPPPDIVPPIIITGLMMYMMGKVAKSEMAKEAIEAVTPYGPQMPKALQPAPS